MIRHVRARTAQRKDGQDIRLERISHHEKPRRLDFMAPENCRIGRFVFLGENFDPLEMCRETRLWIGFLNDLFYGRSHIAAPAELSILFCLMKNPLLYRSARPESSREASERFLIETLGRTQSERHRRLALAGGFRIITSRAARPWACPCQISFSGFLKSTSATALWPQKGTKNFDSVRRCRM